MRAKLALVRGTPYGARATRYRERRLSHNSSSLPPETVMAMPDWLLATEEEQVMLAKAIAILLYRPAIDSELSGTKLAALSDAIGESLFDDLCDLSLPNEMPETMPRDLPRPEDLEAIGREQMQRAVPVQLLEQFSGALGDPLSAALCAIAAKLTLRSGSSA